MRTAKQVFIKKILKMHRKVIYDLFTDVLQRKIFGFYNSPLK